MAPIRDEDDPFKTQKHKEIDIGGQTHQVQVEEFDRGDGKGKRKVVAVQAESGGGAQRFDFGSPEAKKLAEKYPELKEWAIHDGNEADPEKADLRRRIAELEKRDREANAHKESSLRENAARSNARDRRQAGFGASLPEGVSERRGVAGE